MCTVSWLRLPAGYQVFFNRDELNTRAPGIAPEQGETRGVPWIAPLDGDHHGTWIGVNAHGVALGLLNRWGDSPAEDPPDGGYVSRGKLVLDLLDARSLEEVTSRLTPEATRRYRPFVLAGFAMEHDAVLWSWDGATVSRSTHHDSGLVATSSGHDQRLAETVRGEVFRGAHQWRAGQFLEAHRSHLPASGPASVCMHRPDASTVSAVAIAVGPPKVHLEYIPGPPCFTTTSHRLTLERLG